MQAQRILETCLYADDLDAAERFYRDVLGLVFIDRQPGRHVFFRCGNQMLLIFNAQESQAPEGQLPPHGTRGAGHVAFAATAAELDVWKGRLAAANVEIEDEIDWSGRGRSIYFRDPAGNCLEIAMPGIWGLRNDDAREDAVSPS